MRLTTSIIKEDVIRKLLPNGYVLVYLSMDFDKCDYKLCILNIVTGKIGYIFIPPYHTIRIIHKEICKIVEVMESWHLSLDENLSYEEND